MNVLNAIISVLSTAKQPLHAKEIAEKLIATGLWHSNGKTPVATISARLYTDIKKNGDQSSFIQVSPQTFSLRNIQLVSVCDANSQISNQDKKTGTISFLDSAEKVLNQFGNNNAMHYRDITKKAIEMGWLSSTGKTPEATMNAQLVTDLKRTKTNGEPGRFIRTSPGCYSLVKWMGSGLPYEISKHNREVKKKLLIHLMTLNPAQFEELVAQLLAEMGFESIEVTKYSGDAGIDVRGTLQISDVIRIKMAVQVKRWKNNIQSPTVQQVRGSLGVHEQGLIITTSDFSKGAIEEANKADKTPVALMNGEQLVTLLMEYSIGVKRVSHDLFELED